MKNAQKYNPDHCRQILTEQQISAAGPGTILSDIQILIDFIGTGGLATQSNQGNLPSSVLPELNARLSQPLELNHQRPLMRDYPNIAGAYVLLRVMNLVLADEKRISINEEALSIWAGLNPAEKYFTLLEAWLIHADEEVLGSSQRRRADQFLDNLRFLASLPVSKWKTFDEHCHVYRRDGCVSTWNTQLQLRFGLVEVQPKPLTERKSGAKGWIMQAAKRTPWGTAVSWAILEFLGKKEEKRDDDDWLCFYSLPEGAGFGFLKPAFQPFQREWQKVFSLGKPVTIPGMYIFKVSLDPRYYGGPIWRRMAVPGEVTLDGLAAEVLKAFHFEDDEHLHEFRYRDHLGKARVYNHPYSEEGPFTNDILVEESGLPEKGTMKFLFDFGDSWRFLIRLDRIDPPASKYREFQIIDSAGKPPKQYPNWE
jgi:hypothetical protein